jgi:hypothetical protein
MLGKIANVQIVPYKTKYKPVTKTENNTEPETDVIEEKIAIVQAVLGGFTVRQGEYLPSGPNGFLTDRNYQIINNSGAPDIPKDPQSFKNTSKRTGPYITSAEISIGDNSQGMMNTATVNIIIPNPGRDIDYFESVYLRPGRHVTMIFEHPESAIISRDVTSGLLDTSASGSLPSVERLKKIDPSITNETERNSRYARMNKITLDAVIISFTLDYQPDGSVQASLSMRGPSQLYTDVTMYISEPENSSEKDTKDEKEKPNKKQTFFSEISDSIDERIKNLGGLEKDNCVNITDNPDDYILWGKPYADAKQEKYITLGRLIDEVNKLIVTKSTSLLGKQKILFTSSQDLTQSVYHEELVSSNPNVLFIPGGKHDTYGETVWFKQLNSKKPNAFTKTTSGVTGEQPITGNNKKFLPSRFFININYIQEIIQTMEGTESYNLNTFISMISSKVNSLTGESIDLKLITHPTVQNALLLYDTNNVVPVPEDKKQPPVVPYSVPMFANHPIGTIVRDFTFSGKLPSDAANLAYVLNSNPENLSENDIAPFLSYMYSAAVTERDAPGVDTINSLVDKNDQIKAEEKYKETHKKYFEELQQAKREYGAALTDADKQNALRDKLKQHLQFPTDTITKTTQLKAPVIPFDCSFTIDGINGFKYGDVVQFDGLPKRYTSNTVFSIVHVTHTLGSNGQWTTAIRCIMRPKID